MTQPREITPSLRGASGAEVIHETLKAEGVETIFGYPGAAVIPILDVLYDSPIEFILSRHEQGACHMADGYARSTGRVGTVLATSGPGALNLVTGLATAHMDSAPIVALTGQVKSHLIGNDAFQEADTTGVTRPVTKHNLLVRRPEDLASALHEAYHVARTGRPGPVLVDVPVDLTVARMAAEPERSVRLPGYKLRMKANARQIRAAAEAINAAKRPVLYVGGGVIASGATEALRALASKGRIPVTTTLMALGAVDESDELSLGMLGMHGLPAANFAVQGCALLIAVGARFDDRVTGNVDTFAPRARIMHVDVDPTSISKTVRAHIPVVGDARDVLERMLPLIESGRRDGWLERIGAWRRDHPLAFAREGNIRPQEAVEALGELTNHDAIIATGVGQHQMWAAQLYGWRRPRQIITSGGLGTMGFGCPAAVGAQRGNPGRTVVDIDGDGSFAMTMVEVITAVQYDLPVKFLVLDNGYLGMVRQWQELFHDRRYSAVDHPCPNFAAIAEGFGARGLAVRDRSELTDGIAEMLRTEGPAVLTVAVEPEENVYPMVPAGKGLHEMELGSLA